MLTFSTFSARQSVRVLAVASLVLVWGCPKPTPLAIAGSASESLQVVGEYERSIRPIDYCEYRRNTNSSEDRTIQEFDAMDRLVRRSITLSPGPDTEIVVEHQTLDDGTTETEAVSTTQLDSGERVQRTITRIDAMGREVFMGVDRGNDGSIETMIETSYTDSSNTKTTTINSSVSTATTTRDEFGNVVSIVTMGPGGTSEVRTTYSADGSQPMQRTETPTGIETTWSYNAAGFESRMERTRNGLRLQERVWEFDGDGSPISVVDREFIPGGVRTLRDADVVYSGNNLISEDGTRFIDNMEFFVDLAATRTFQYDADDRLISETITSDEGTWTGNLTWSAEGLLQSYRSQRGPTFDQRSYTYDSSGRLTQLVRSSAESNNTETWDYSCR